MLRKGDGMWWGAWPGPLASMESWSCSHFPARLSSEVYHSLKGFVDFLGSLPPGHEKTSLFSLRPHALLQMANWLLSSFGSFCRGFGTSFMLQLPCPCQLISIDLALRVPNKAEGSQARPQWSSCHPDISKSRYSEIASQGVKTLGLALGVNVKSLGTKCCFSFSWYQRTKWGGGGGRKESERITQCYLCLATTYFMLLCWDGWQLWEGRNMGF